MERELDDEQQLLWDTANRFIRTTCPISRVRELIDDARGCDGDYLRGAAELGWFAMFVPESQGGGTVSGAPLADAAVIAELRGRHLQPGPFVHTNVAALAVADYGNEKQQIDHLPVLASGEAIASLAIIDGRGQWSHRDVDATAVGDGFILNGAKTVVQDLHLADWLLVAASVDGAPTMFLVPATAVGVTRIPLEAFDLTRRFGRVTFESVTVPADAVLGAVGSSADALGRELDLCATLSLAETVGSMAHLFEMTVQYAKDRVAFGRPIGSFQGIKHQLADMSLQLEASKAAVRAAVEAVQARRKDAAEVVSIAKAYVGDASTELAQGCLQVHGGIGYTWEHDLHLYYRRLASDLSLFGDPAWHRERICAIHEL